MHFTVSRVGAKNKVSLIKRLVSLPFGICSPTGPRTDYKVDKVGEFVSYVTKVYKVYKVENASICYRFSVPHADSAAILIDRGSAPRASPRFRIHDGLFLEDMVQTAAEKWPLPLIITERYLLQVN